MSFLERLAQRALDLDQAVPRAMAKDLPLRQRFIPPPAGGPDLPPAAPRSAGPDEGAAGSGRPDPGPASSPAIARQTSPPPIEETEERREEEPPARTMRVQRRVAEDPLEPEDAEEKAQTLRRMAAEPRDEPVDEEPERAQPLRRRISPAAVGGQAAGLPVPPRMDQARPGIPAGAGSAAPPAATPAPALEDTGPPAAPDIGAPEAGQSLEDGTPPEHSPSPAEPGAAMPPEKPRFESPAVERPAPAPLRPRTPPPWPLAAAEPAALPPSPARPEVVIEHIEVVVEEPAPPRPPALTPPFRRAISARYLRSL